MNVLKNSPRIIVPSTVAYAIVYRRDELSETWANIEIEPFKTRFFQTTDLKRKTDFNSQTIYQVRVCIGWSVHVIHLCRIDWLLCECIVVFWGRPSFVLCRLR